MIKFLKSSIGSKQVIGLAGLGLAVFVFAHMAGNMLIFVSPEAYNKYGHALTSNPLIYFAEAGLVAIFLGHVILSLWLSWKNWKSRGSQAYTYKKPKKTKASLASRTMWAQGLVILVFIILHLLTFKFANDGYYVEYGGEKMRDLHRLMIEVFQQPLYVVGYTFCLLLLWGHLSHGVSSVFQSLGMTGERSAPAVKTIGWIYALVVCLGFISQPLYVYFFYSA